MAVVLKDPWLALLTSMCHKHVLLGHSHTALAPVAAWTGRARVEWAQWWRGHLVWALLSPASGTLGSRSPGLQLLC